MNLSFPTSPRKLPWLLLISTAVIVLDRASKVWVSQHIRLGGAIPVLPGILRITHWTNEGAAFSLFADSTHPALVHWGLIGFTVLAAIALLAAMLWLGEQFTLTTVALSMIFGGAIGNVHDRIAYGSVVDFIEVHIYHYHWPDFNVADSAIVCGAALLMLDALLPKEEEEGEA